MELGILENHLIAAIADGLPLTSRPFAEIGREVGLSEEEVLTTLRQMQETGLIKRFGLVVRHHELGYRSNAMVVWDIPDDRVDEVGQCFGNHDFVTLCYQRPRRLPDWPYNLFCMVHGQERDKVLAQVSELAEACCIKGASREILFSLRRFKQRGAHYGAVPKKESDRLVGAGA